MHAELLSDILIVLAAAVLAVALFHRLHLPAAGASRALPENLEASLVFGGEILLIAGVPPEQVGRSVAQLRSELHPLSGPVRPASDRASFQ